jgi:hypothetical protein
LRPNLTPLALARQRAALAALREWRAGEPEPGLRIEKHGVGQTAFELTPDRGLLRRLGGEAFGDDRLTVRRVRAIRRPCRPLFPDLS